MKNKYLEIHKRLIELEKLGVNFPKGKNIKNYFLLIKKEFEMKFENMDNYFIHIIDNLQDRIDAAKALKKRRQP
jgi:hypothetical protein